MEYMITIPCSPRIIDGVDENMKTYLWSKARDYKFVRFHHTPRTDIEASNLAWVMVKITDEPSPERKKKPAPPDQAPAWSSMQAP